MAYDAELTFRRFEIEETYKGQKFYGIIEKLVHSGDPEHDRMTATARMDDFPYYGMPETLSPEDNKEIQDELIEGVVQGIRNIQDEEHETPFQIGQGILIYKVPELEDYKRAYNEWYCKTARNPVSLQQYIKVMDRMPEDIKQINRWLDEGRQPLRKGEKQ